VLTQQPEEMGQTSGGLATVPATVPCQPADIAVQKSFIEFAKGMALPLQPPAKLVAGAQTILDTARRLTLPLQDSGELFQVRPERVLLQTGNHSWPYKDGIDHGLLLLGPDGLRKSKPHLPIMSSGSTQKSRYALRLSATNPITRHDPGLGMMLFMPSSA